MKRKGSMQLSIEAIIILVIAFTLLGFGIVFVRNVFEKAGSNAAGALEGKACNTAASDTPITPDKFSITRGSSAQTALCVYNNAASDLQAVRPFLEGCTDPLSGNWNANPPINITVGPLDIKRNVGSEYKVTFKANSSANLGSYICNIYAQNASKLGEKIGPVQVTVEVK